MKKQKIGKITDFSAKALREFAENRRIFNKAVQKAIAENKKYGIKRSLQFSK
jgi:hypothetical protein